MTPNPRRLYCRPDCPVCQGTGFYSCDVPIFDPTFGKLHVCPHANIPPPPQPVDWQAEAERLQRELLRAYRRIETLEEKALEY